MIIENDKEYQQALVECNVLKDVPLDSPEGERLLELIYALDEYEENVLGIPA